jgi:aminomethyltransferase
MPLQYSGIVDEHHAVRRCAGLFDVSHMGEIEFTGPGAMQTVHRLVPNDVTRLRDGQVLYSPICYEHGGIVDDCLVYRVAEQQFSIVVNASNIEKDLAWFRQWALPGCSVENVSEDRALIALQGPKSALILSALSSTPVTQIAPFHFVHVALAGVTCQAARTGYTGEDGFEVMCSPDSAPALWQALIDVGQPHGLKPCGLGARDTLRLEARLPLYGNDIDETTTPLEAGLRWTVKFKAGDFIGRQPLLQQERTGVKRRLVCLEMKSRGIARHDHPICQAETDGSLGQAIGKITSGTMSPTLGKAIALGYVPAKHAAVGTSVAVDVRGKPVVAEVIKGPFYSRPA